MRVSEAFSEIVELGIALGVKDIAKTPGCWEHRVDEHWWFALNPHSEPTTCSKSAGVPLKPFCVYVEFNGLPAGVLNPKGGTIAAGRLANEDALIEALKTARKAVP